MEQRQLGENRLVVAQGLSGCAPLVFLPAVVARDFEAERGRSIGAIAQGIAHHPRGLRQAQAGRAHGGAAFRSFACPFCAARSMSTRRLRSPLVGADAIFGRVFTPALRAAPSRLGRDGRPRTWSCLGSSVRVCSGGSRPRPGRPRRKEGGRRGDAQANVASAHRLAESCVSVAPADKGSPAASWWGMS
jgi:hypothetical protein